jgi:hypothetical protein
MISSRYQSHQGVAASQLLRYGIQTTVAEEPEVVSRNRRQHLPVPGLGHSGYVAIDVNVRSISSGWQWTPQREGTSSSSDHERFLWVSATAEHLVLIGIFFSREALHRK